MTNRKFNRIVYHDLQRSDFGMNTHSQLQSQHGHGWLLLAAGLIMFFMILSHMGVAS